MNAIPVQTLPPQSAKIAVAITPSNAVQLAFATAYGIYVGVSGDVKVDMLEGGTVVFKAAPVGILAVVAKKVYATGTTATDLVGLA